MRADVENSVRDFIVIFVSIVWEAMPFIVLGAFIAGVLEELLPQQWLTRLIPRNHMLAIPLCSLLGLVFPMCECGIIVVMRRLLRKGLPLSCCVAYMLAGPVINAVVLTSTYVAFVKHQDGLVIVILRAVLAFLVACGTALIVARQYRKHGVSLLVPLAQADVKAGTVAEDDVAPSAHAPWLRRIGNISETALHDFTDITVFLIIGALLAACVRLQLSQDQIADMSAQYPGLSILLMMALAVLLCLCSEADAFVAASFVSLHPAAKLSFLVLGPMLDLKLFMMYTRVYRPRLIWTIIAAVVTQVLIYSYIVEFAWSLGWLSKLSQMLPSVAP
jgi:uncharacterized membrane protein YraQ (UPF0718 family)